MFRQGSRKHRRHKTKAGEQESAEAHMLGLDGFAGNAPLSGTPSSSIRDRRLPRALTAPTLQQSFRQQQADADESGSASAVSSPAYRAKGWTGRLLAKTRSATSAKLKGQMGLTMDSIHDALQENLRSEGVTITEVQGNPPTPNGPFPTAWGGGNPQGGTPQLSAAPEDQLTGCTRYVEMQCAKRSPTYFLAPAPEDDVAGVGAKIMGFVQRQNGNRDALETLGQLHRNMVLVCVDGQYVRDMDFSALHTRIKQGNQVEGVPDVQSPPLRLLFCSPAALTTPPLPLAVAVESPTARSPAHSSGHRRSITVSPPLSAARTTPASHHRNGSRSPFRRSTALPSDGTSPPNPMSPLRLPGGGALGRAVGRWGLTTPAQAPGSPGSRRSSAPAGATGPPRQAPSNWAPPSVLRGVAVSLNDFEDEEGDTASISTMGGEQGGEDSPSFRGEFHRSFFSKRDVATWELSNDALMTALKDESIPCEDFPLWNMEELEWADMAFPVGPGDAHCRLAVAVSRIALYVLELQLAIQPQPLQQIPPTPPEIQDFGREVSSVRILGRCEPPDLDRVLLPYTVETLADGTEMAPRSSELCVYIDEPQESEGVEKRTLPPDLQYAWLRLRSNHHRGELLDCLEDWYSRRMEKELPCSQTLSAVLRQQIRSSKRRDLLGSPPFSVHEEVSPLQTPGAAAKAWRTFFSTKSPTTPPARPRATLLAPLQDEATELGRNLSLNQGSTSMSHE